MSEPVCMPRSRRVAACAIVLTLALAAWGDGVVAAAPPSTMATPREEPFGRLPDGREARVFVLEAPGGWRVALSEYGAAVVSWLVPPPAGGEGDVVDVVLGFDAVAGYLAHRSTFGATCGRCADRIAAATFDLDGGTHRLTANDGPHHLHGGAAGFDRRLWRATPNRTDRGPAVAFELVSPAGDEGYPGRLTARVVYTLTPAGELVVETSATTDAPTIVNLAQRILWNLAGHAAGSIAGHELAVEADRYLPTGPDAIPTGAFAPVEGTPFDFRPERRPWRRCGAAIETLPPDAPPGTPRGVDHTYVVRGWRPGGGLRTVARLRDPASGRALEVRSDQPGVHVSMGNALDGRLVGKGGTVYGPHAGLCVAAQRYPDTVHHPDWPSVRLDPGQVATHVTVYRLTR